MFVPLFPDRLQALDLCTPHRFVVDLQDIDLGLFIQLVFIDTDDNIFTTIDPGLFASSCLLDLQFWQAGFYSLGHAALVFNLLDQGPGPVG